MSEQSAPRTVLEIIRSTTAFFSKKEVESPRLNAEHLVAHVLRKRRLDLYLEFDRPLGDHELAPMRDLVRRRSQGEPLQHLLGTVDFYGRLFQTDGRALIPRPETEQLVELVLRECKARGGGGPLRILDVGTGSGVIGLTLAAELPNATIHAVDLSPEALALAAENAALLGLSGRAEFQSSDLLEAVSGRFSVIVANLPYIASAVVPSLAREVQHDPHIALDGGTLGHEIIARLIAAAPSHLEPGGLLALEIGADQSATLSRHLEAAEFQQIRCAHDLQGVNRFLLATYG